MWRVLILVMLFPAALLGQLIPQDELPFGAYSSKWANDQNYFSFDSTRLENMHSELGFNQHMSGGFDTATVNKFYQKGIFPYPWGSALGVNEDDQVKYAHTTYFVTQPESSAYYGAKFTPNACGHSETINDSIYFVYGDSGLMLSNLKLGLPNMLQYFPSQLQYHLELKIAIDTSWTDINQVVGIFRVINGNLGADSLRFMDVIKVEDITQTKIFNPILLGLINDMPDDSLNPYFTVMDSVNSNSGFSIRFEFETFGNCHVYVDYFKVYDPNGQELFAGNRNNYIRHLVTRRGYKDKILGWFLVDTEGPAVYRPFAYIDSLIRTAVTDSGWNYRVGGHAWLNAPIYTHGSYPDFIRICKPETVWTFLYPIWMNTKYAGYERDVLPRGLQGSFEVEITTPLDTLREIMKNSERTREWVYTPQYWYCDPADGCTGDELRRKPTPSEVRCETYLGLCYKPCGILSWKYDTNSEGDAHGIVDYNGYPTPGIYNVIRDDINPYIKAIDSTYMGLTWERAFAYNPENGFNPPGNSVISSINAVSITAGNNPDLSWFQVGEYHDTTFRQNKYFMLVNRACSRDGYGNPAPTIAATITFKPPTTPGDSAYFVVDIAKTLRNAPDTGWIGTPETTLCNPFNGAISYTTELKAGEGRLYEIIPARKMQFTGEISNTRISYQGQFNASNMTVAGMDTLKIIGPSELSVSSNQPIKLLRAAGLITKGYPEKEVVFKSIGMSAWDAITFESDAGINLQYSSIQSTKRGIYATATNRIILSHCSISRAKDALTAFGRPKAIFLDSCEIDFSFNSGITVICPDSIRIYKSHFNENNKYAICVSNAKYMAEFESVLIDGQHNYGVKYYGGSTNTQPKFHNVTFQGTSSQSTIAGIYVAQDTCSYEPAPIISYSLLRGFASGIELHNTTSGTTIGPGVTCAFNTKYGLLIEDKSYAEINGMENDYPVMNLFQGNGVDGLCANNSSGIVTRCNFWENENSGVELWNCSFDFGTDGEGGLNSFGEFGSGPALLAYEQGVSAQYNWWGATEKDSIKQRITENVIFEPWLESEYKGKIALNHGQLPTEFTLSSTYPNPFNAYTKIDFAIPAQTNVTLIIYNILGQEIRQLCNQDMQPGYYSIIWDGKDNNGHSIASGVYLYSIQTAEKVITKKMAMLK